jgi:hypothetical protein
LEGHPVTNTLPDATKNALLNSAVSGGFITSGTHLALFTGFPPAIGGNEVTGGSPAYARKAVTFTATAAAGAISPSSGTPATFDVPATTVRAVGVCTASTAGTLLAWAPAGASARRACSVDAAGVTNNDITSAAHGLVAGNSVLFWAAVGAALPTGLAEDTEYFVIATGLATDTFRVSTTLGGSAVDITAIGDGDVQKFTPEVSAAQATYQVTQYTASLPG